MIAKLIVTQTRCQYQTDLGKREITPKRQTSRQVAKKKSSKTSYFMTKYRTKA